MQVHRNWLTNKRITKMFKDAEVKISVLINAGISKVWDAIINPEITKKYMHNIEVISDWKAGSSILWRDAVSKKVHVKGIVLNIEPERYLETKDLSIDSGLPDIESNYSRVTYELTIENDKTFLTVTENNFNGDKRRYNDSEKFWNVVIINLKELLEK